MWSTKTHRFAVAQVRVERTSSIDLLCPARALRAASAICLRPPVAGLSLSLVTLQYVLSEQAARVTMPTRRRRDALPLSTHALAAHPRHKVARVLRPALITNNLTSAVATPAKCQRRLRTLHTVLCAAHTAPRVQSIQLECKWFVSNERHHFTT